MNKIYFTSLLICTSIFVTACTTQTRQATLRDIDVITKNDKQEVVFIKPKSDEEIRLAYQSYLENTSNNNKSRMTAINRLADIEFNLSNKLLEDSKTNNSDNSSHDIFDDKKYNAKLDKTIKLLVTSLRDYPKEKNNDRILYQLAKAYEQKSDISNSVKILKKLIKKFPKSPYYIEAQFRIAEAAFTRQNYISAEDAYTEVISSKKNELYYEKSTFKRGWARFKQSFYVESVDDFISAILFHSFEQYSTLTKAEKSQYDEYYRSIGLAFAYAGGVEPLHNYIKENNNLEINYQIYASVSNIFLKQERYSDAVSLLEDFIKTKAKSRNIPYAYLKIMNIWSNGGFSGKLSNAVNRFYTAYNPNSSYWKKKNTDTAINKSITISLKKYILQMSGYFHKSYQQEKLKADLQNASLWYKRYLKHYQSYVRKDNINYLYAELLSTAKNTAGALKYYEIAAYDNDIILNKNAAYATIIFTNKLYRKYKNKINLNKHIEYATRFAQLYPNDKRTSNIVIHASELAFTNKQFRKAIKLTEILATSSSTIFAKKSGIIIAQSYFNLAKYSEAEKIYADLLHSEKSDEKSKIELRNNLALSIYKQGEVAKKNKNIPEATNHFMRISDVVPGSDIAATGLFDAIALFMSTKTWNEAITSMKKFQHRFPKHKLNRKISRNLSIAYLNSNQNLKAAQEFEKLSSEGDNKEIKMTALWQAAELYEKKKNYKSAIRSYKKYAKTYKKPFSQLMESMQKLVELNTQVKNAKQVYYWRNQIIRNDKRAYKKYKTARTKYLASSSLLSFARNKDRQYRKHKLVRPLKRNLLKKKKAMQQAVLLYGKASVFKISETSTEATYAIASIYNDFSKSLLNSETPKNLNKNEREQYKILIEDQAFPFEEKAIEFYELNMRHVKNNTYNNWVKKSFANLKILFPVRYKRTAKIDGYINVLH